jgi:putative ABC transport system permease protein
MEVYQGWVEERGKRKADIRFIIEVLLLFRPGIIRSANEYNNVNNYTMIKSYFKIGWRNLMKDKVFSFINISGLTLGITVCLMIFLFVSNEFNVDRSHAQGKDIYRVMRGFPNDGKTTSVPYLSGLYAPALLNDFNGDVLQAVRVKPTDGLLTFGLQSFHETKILGVDSGFFSLFSFQLLRGNANDVLKYPESVVLTEATAKKYFGSIDNAMDQVIVLDQRVQLKVTGIAADVSNSHLEFNVIVPVSNYKDEESMNYWISNALYTYVLLAPHVTPAQLEDRFVQFIDKYMGADLKKFGFHWNLTLMPLKDVYFTPGFDGAKHGDKTMVYIFLSIATLILLIGCINFINLSTVRGSERSKEVGLRKVMGAFRSNLIWQFIGESALIAIISCMLSIGLLVVSLPWYNELLGHALTISWNTFSVYLFLLGVVVIVGFLAGSYPAFFLSAFSPVQALKGKLRFGSGGSVFRQALVVVQFSISVFLILGTVIITKQMGYVKNKELGYDKEQTVIVPIDNEDIYKNRRQFKSLLQEEANVQSVSIMSGEPGGFFDGHKFEVEGLAEKWGARTEFADFDYVKTLGLKIIAGRDFSPGSASDSAEAVLINRTAATKLGWTPDQAVDKWIKNTIRDNARRRVIGVVEDFNFQSLKTNIEPLVISPSEDWRTILIKTTPGDLPAIINSIRDAYTKVAPAYPLEYFFLDDQFDQLYKNNLRQQTVLTIFANVAIFVACLGLFGLASFTTKKRFKEIGVRKVLGSSVPSIVVLLSKDLLKPVVIAIFIALPIGYYAMNTWLQDFAYKTKLDWWVFVLASLITFYIALITVCYQAIKSATANPVESLRSE